MFLIRVIFNIFKIFFHAFQRMSREDGLMAAGYIAFNGFLSLFPFLIFLAAAAGFLTTPDDIPRILDFMFRFVPQEIAEALAPAITEIVSTKPAGLLTFGFIATLWSSSNGIESLRLALNRAYYIKKFRPLWRRRAQSIFFIIFSSLTIFFISIVIVLSPLIWSLVAPLLHLGILGDLIFNFARFSFSIIVLMVALVILHKYLPNRAEHRHYNIYPGVILTTIIFFIGGTAFSAFLNNFGNFSVAYGSLGSVMITLIFFYFSAILFIFGAYFNVELAQRRTDNT